MAGTLKIKDLPPESRPREAFMRSRTETRRLREAGEIVGIPLDDHVVIGRNAHVSIIARLDMQKKGLDHG